MDKNVVMNQREYPGIIHSLREHLERSFRRRICEKDPLLTSIALLSDQDIHLMSECDLRDIIRMAQNSLSEPTTFHRLSSLGRPDLVPLALLVRFRLRKWINAGSERHGYTPFFWELIAHR